MIQEIILWIFALLVFILPYACLFRICELLDKIYDILSDIKLKEELEKLK